MQRGARVFGGERPLGRVVGAAFASKDQETAQLRPIIDGERVAARAVGDLCAAENRLRLGRGARVGTVGAGQK
jgi:hypothetical protein